MGGSTITYLILVSTAALGVFNLIKDWDSHGSNARRYAVLILLAVVCILGVVNVAISDHRSVAEKRTAEERARKSEEREKQSAAEILRLEQAVESAQKAQETNNRSFFEQLNKLYTKTESEHLRKEIRASQQRILKNLKVEPPAQLLASFEVQEEPELPLMRKALKLADDGAVQVDLVAFNVSEVAAKPGECIVRVCRACKYAAEPAKMIRPVGAEETDRTRPFEFVVPHTGMALSLKIIPPPASNGFQIDLSCGCQNCSNNKKQALWVDLLR
jgi:hypothetical protein